MVTDWGKLEEYRAEMEELVIRNGKFTKGKGKGMITTISSEGNTKGAYKQAVEGKDNGSYGEAKEKGQKKGRDKRED